MDLLDEAGLSYQIVLTKADQLKPAALATLRAKLAAQVRKRRRLPIPRFRRPARTRTGIAELRSTLAALAAWRQLGRACRLISRRDSHGLRALP